MPTPRETILTALHALLSALPATALRGEVLPNPEMANAIRLEALKRGPVLLTCGIYGNVIRFLVPLTIPDEIFTEAMDVLETSIDAVKGR